MSLLGDLRQAGRQLAAEAVEGAQRVVLLSHRAWTSRFASAPDVIGAPIVLNDEPHTVFGVLPDGFESSFLLHAGHRTSRACAWRGVVWPSTRRLACSLLVVGPPNAMIPAARLEREPCAPCDNFRGAAIPTV